MKRHTRRTKLRRARRSKSRRAYRTLRRRGGEIPCSGMALADPETKIDQFRIIIRDMIQKYNSNKFYDFSGEVQTLQGTYCNEYLEKLSNYIFNLSINSEDKNKIQPFYDALIARNLE